MGIEKLAVGLPTISPGTRKYAALLVKGLKKNYPRGWRFVVKEEMLTDEGLVNLYMQEHYLFEMWIKMIMWVEKSGFERAKMTLGGVKTT